MVLQESLVRIQRWSIYVLWTSTVNHVYAQAVFHCAVVL
jgi:hypothetical protein